MSVNESYFQSSFDARSYVEVCPLLPIDLILEVRFGALISMEAGPLFPIDQSFKDIMMLWVVWKLIHYVKWIPL